LEIRAQNEAAGSHSRLAGDVSFERALDDFGDGPLFAHLEAMREGEIC